MATTRIYIVQANGKQHLVDAKSPSQAISYVTTQGVTCEPATSKDVAALMSEGVKLETAGAEPDPAQLPLQEAA